MEARGRPLGTERSTSVFNRSAEANDTPFEKRIERVRGESAPREAEPGAERRAEQAEEARTHGRDERSKPASERRQREREAREWAEVRRREAGSDAAPTGDSLPALVVDPSAYESETRGALGLPADGSAASGELMASDDPAGSVGEADAGLDELVAQLEPGPDAGHPANPAHRAHQEAGKGSSSADPGGDLPLAPEGLPRAGAALQQANPQAQADSDAPPEALSGPQLEQSSGDWDAGDGEAAGGGPEEGQTELPGAAERAPAQRAPGPNSGAEPGAVLEAGSTEFSATEAGADRTGSLRTNAPQSGTEAAAKPAPPNPSSALPPEQAAAIFKQVRMHLAPGQRQATIHLQPAWLGRVSIRVEVRDGRALAELRAERPESLAALEQHIPELRAALAERGFEQAEFDLGLYDSGAGDQGEAGLRADRGREPLNARLNLPSALAEDDATASALRGPSITDLGVDTYA